MVSGFGGQKASSYSSRVFPRFGVQKTRREIRISSKTRGSCSDIEKTNNRHHVSIEDESAR